LALLHSIRKLVDLGGVPKGFTVRFEKLFRSLHRIETEPPSYVTLAIKLNGQFSILLQSRTDLKAQFTIQFQSLINLKVQFSISSRLSLTRCFRFQSQIELKAQFTNQFQSLIDLKVQFTIPIWLFPTLCLR
jgi:hypothetical protein